jgi:hypothetical protein
MRRLFAGVAALVLSTALAGVVTTPAAHATAPTTTTPSNPATEVLAVVSPIASPACGASGVATLLVPIVGGVLQTDLGLPKSVSIGTLLLNALGPVYVVCGDLPGSGAGTHCSLDDQLAGIWPAALPADGLIAPTPIGNLVDSIDNGLKVLGLPPSAALQTALQCQVEAATTAPKAPGAPLASSPGVTTPAAASVAASSLPPTSALAVPTSGGGSLPTSQGLTATGSPASAATTPPASGERLVSFLRHHLPSWLLALQLMAAAVLALVLTGSWLTSAMVSRHGGDR